MPVLAVKVRNNMAAASEGDGSKIDALKSVFTNTGSTTADDTTVAASNRSTTSAGAKASKRNSTFKIVPTRDSMVLPDVGHERGWVRKASEKDELAKEGEGWKSSAYVSYLCSKVYLLTFLL